MSAAHSHLHSEHAHSRTHDGHAHGHSHPPAGPAPARSLLLLSLGQRLAGSAVLVAGLWAAVLWAIR